MDKGAKILCIILSIIAVMLLGVYAFLSGVNKQIPRPVEYPKGDLSQSIFDAQNTKYEPNSSLTEKHYFAYSPYSVDMMPTEAVKLSDVGRVYKLSENRTYFYITEYENGTSVESVIRNELPQSVMIDANVEMTAIDKITYEEGYRNGFKADYYIFCMTVTNGTRTSSVYMTAYTLTITDDALEHGHKMFLSVVSTENSTTAFESAKGMLDAVVGTSQINYDIQDRLVDEENRMIQEEEQRRAEALERGESYIPQIPGQQPRENLVVSTDNASTDMAANADAVQYPAQAEGTQQQVSEYIRQDAIIGNVNNNAGDGQGGAANANIPQKKIKSMTLDKTYTSVTLTYTYANTEEDIKVTLESPDGTTQYAPQSTVAGSAVFKLDVMEQGKWHLNIEGNPGQDAMKLYSAEMEAAQ